MYGYVLKINPSILYLPQNCEFDHIVCDLCVCSASIITNRQFSCFILLTEYRHLKSYHVFFCCLFNFLFTVSFIFMKLIVRDSLYFYPIMFYKFLFVMYICYIMRVYSCFMSVFVYSLDVFYIDDFLIISLKFS